MPRYIDPKPKPKIEPMTEIPRIGNASLQQAAKLIGFHPRTLRSKARQGKWPGRLVEGRWKFPWAWVRMMCGEK